MIPQNFGDIFSHFPPTKKTHWKNTWLLWPHGEDCCNLCCLVATWHLQWTLGWWTGADGWMVTCDLDPQMLVVDSVFGRLETPLKFQGNLWVKWNIGWWNTWLVNLGDAAVALGIFSAYKQAHSVGRLVKYDFNLARRYTMQLFWTRTKWFPYDYERKDVS